MNSPSTDEGWKEVAEAKMGHVFYDEFHDGIRVLVVRGPCALCAYLGIAKGHPLADFSYDDIPMSVHGGLTYAGNGVKGAPEGHYWFGWDYSHAGDACQYRDGVPDHHKDSHHWTVKEVVTEAKDAVWDFRKVVLLAERIALKKSGLLLATERR